MPPFLGGELYRRLIKIGYRQGIDGCQYKGYRKHLIIKLSMLEQILVHLNEIDSGTLPDAVSVKLIVIIFGHCY